MQEVIQASLVDFEDAGTSLTILDDLKSVSPPHRPFGYCIRTWD